MQTKKTAVIADQSVNWCETAAPFGRSAQWLEPELCFQVTAQVKTVQVLVIVTRPTIMALMIPAMYGFFVLL